MKVNWQTVTIAGICVVAGTVLVAMGKNEMGGMLISFGVGAAAMKPAVSK
jgi:hypothetical protein